MVDMLSRTNIFVNPFFAAEANTAGAGGTIAYTSSDADFTTAAVHTRNTTGAARLSAVSTTTATSMTASSAATIGVSLKSSVTATVDIYWRPNGVSSTTGEVLLASGVSLPANTAVALAYQFTTSATAPVTGAGLSIISASGAVGQTLTMSRILWSLGSNDGTAFSGATTDTALYEYAWTGSVNLSTSTETLHIPEYAPGFTGSGTLSAIVGVFRDANFSGSGTLGLGYVARENEWPDPFNQSASGWVSTNGTAADANQSISYPSQAGIEGSAVQSERLTTGGIWVQRPFAFLPNTQYTVAFDIVTNFANVGVQVVAKPVSATSNTGQVLSANTSVVPVGGATGTVVRVVSTFTTGSQAVTTPHLGFLIRQANGTSSSGIVAGQWVRFGEVAVFRGDVPANTAAFSGATASAPNTLYSWVGAANASASRETVGSQIVVTTQANFAGSGSLSFAMHTYVEANFTGSGALAAGVEILPAVRFTPPIERVLDVTGNRLLDRLGRQLGITLLKEDGLYRQVREPMDEEIVVADIAYLGGHDYIVTSEEADDLDAAGYGDNLGYVGYGTGNYGEGDYGIS